VQTWWSVLLDAQQTSYIGPTLLFSNIYQRPDIAISGIDPHAQNMNLRRFLGG
jgi:hypothetical protein